MRLAIAFFGGLVATVGILAVGSIHPILMPIAAAWLGVAVLWRAK